MSPNLYNTTNERPIYIGEKKVAVLRDDRLLDIRKHTDHFIYLKDDSGEIQRAVCIATETLRQARKASAIQVVDIERQVRYIISRKDFDKRSFDFETARKTGFETQRACYLKWFASNEPTRKNYPAHIEAEPLPMPKQLGLFER